MISQMTIKFFSLFTLLLLLNGCKHGPITIEAKDVEKIELIEIEHHYANESLDISLLNDDLKKEHAVSIDYYRKLKNNLYLNASITHSRVKIKPISATFVVGGYVVDPAPPT